MQAGEVSKLRDKDYGSKTPLMVRDQVYDHLRNLNIQ